MLYQFKQQPEDFIVEELLPALPSGKGDVFYVYFEKRNLTTMEVIEHLQRSFPLSREELGIAGLKDKVGITRQWMSVFRSVLVREGGVSAFLSVLGEKVTVLQTQRGDSPLKVGGNVGNRFEVRLRATGAMRDGDELSRSALLDSRKALIEQNVKNIQAKGFPNCFGYQRFGKRMKNFWEAKKVLELKAESRKLKVESKKLKARGEVLKETGDYHLRFMLQAYASGYFNEYVMSRWEKGLHFLEGDIVTDRYYANGARVGVYQQGAVRCFDYEQMKKKYKEKGVWELTDDGLFPCSSFDSQGLSGTKWIPT
jgi:tRNA pseudouridine13 synthase